MMTNEMIAKLEAKGGKRWTKGNMDRMYFNATALGLELDYYKSGNICDAYFKGEKISNAKGGRYACAKTYVDLSTGMVCGTCEELTEVVREIVADTETELAAEAEAGKNEEAEEDAKEESEDKEMKQISLDNGATYMDAAETIEYISTQQSGMLTDEELEQRRKDWWTIITDSMDDETREAVAFDHAPCTDEEFLAEYLRRADADLIIG